MSELSPETRAWVDAAGRGDAPRDEDRARIRQRLACKLGAAALATATVTITAQASALPASALTVSKTSLGLLGKLAIATALAGAVSTTALVSLRATRDEAAITASGQPQSSVHSGMHMKRSSRLERAQPVATAPQPIVEQLSPSAPVALTTTPAITKRARSKAATSAPEASIAEELALLREAHLALRAGRPDDVLAHTREHSARFPRGALRQERAAVEMLALCAQGKASSAVLTAFLESAPESPLKTRVRAACQGK